MGVSVPARGVKVGEVKLYPVDAVPVGWLRCNGAAISRSAYALLFAAIGTQYGVGDGATTFNLPDYRGEFPRFSDDGRGVDAGRGVGSWQADAFKSHTHAMAKDTSGFATGGSTLDRLNGGASGNVADGATRSSGSAETRPRNVALLACIVYQ